MADESDGSDVDVIVGDPCGVGPVSGFERFDGAHPAGAAVAANPVALTRVRRLISVPGYSSWAERLAASRGRAQVVPTGGRAPGAADPE